MIANNRILIISSNLESGYCGVSDYVFVLQSFFKKQGFECALLALSDKYCTEIIEDENSLRIPFNTGSITKLKLANDFIEFFKPSKIYFNLVSYGYNTKGLPFYLLDFLPVISIKYKLVIIAHELWAGNFKNESFKNKIWGKVQSILFLSLFKKLANTEIVVTTSIAKNILESNSVKSRVVPVFSNIPFHLMQESLVTNTNIKLILFGASLFKINHDLFIEFLNQLLDIHKKNILIDIVGMKNADIIDWGGIVGKLKTDKIKSVKHGFLPATEISFLMQGSNIGLTTYMPEFWSKSGAIAAMLAHGLPIVSIADQVVLDKFSNDLLLHPRIWNLIQLQNNSATENLNPISINPDYNLYLFNQLVNNNEELKND